MQLMRPLPVPGDLRVAKQRSPAFSGAHLRVRAGNVVGGGLLSGKISPSRKADSTLSSAKKNYKLILRGRIRVTSMECKGASYDGRLESPSRDLARAVVAQ